MLLAILLLFVIESTSLWAITDDSSDDGEEPIYSLTTQAYNKPAKMIEDDFEKPIDQLQHLLSSVYDFSEDARALLKQKIDQLTQDNPETIQYALQITAVCKQLFPFAPEQRIFLWYLTSSDPLITIKSFIPALRDLPNDQLVEVDHSLRLLPTFFSRHAFNQVNNGYLEGDMPPLQKWLNVSITCQAIAQEISKLVDPKERFEVAYHLMFFMQHRSIDLIPYYVEALVQNIKKIEDHYYPFFCLNRRLKGHSILQDRLLRTLKTRYANNFDGLFSIAATLLKTIQIKRYVGPTASLFISQFTQQEFVIEN